MKNFAYPKAVMYPRCAILTVFLFALLVCVGNFQSAFGATFYLSPNGADGNPGTETQPFRTLERARTAVRAVNDNMTEDVTVYLRGGEYSLAAAFVLDQADSGTNGFNVVWRAYPNEKPVLSGGQQITGWTSVGGGIWKAPVGTLRFRQLYVNGTRAIRARTPNVGSYYTLTNYDDGGRRLQIPANTLANWQNFSQVEMNLLGKGVVNAYLRLSSFSVSGSSAFVIPQEPERTRLFIRSYPTREPGRPYYFENAFEFLDSPGEWYLNTSTNEVFYMPRAGENMASVSIVAPRLENIVRIQGTLSNPAHHIQFHGITFEHTTWTLPSTDGYVGDQGGLAATGAILNDEITFYEGHRPPGGFHMEAADNIRLERNVLRHLGGAGINLHVGNHNNVIIGNVIEDVSNNGIALDMNLEGNPTDTRKISRNNTVRSNYIHDIGKDYYSSIGIVAGYTDGSVIEHNEVHDTPYTGISVGWGWDDVANAARNNLVRYNKVFNVNDTMSDGGGIYTLSRQPGTIIHENHVHDIFRTSIHGGYIMPGIYLDEGSNLITVRDNVIQNVDGQSGSGAIFQNANGPSNTFSNNSGASSTTIANAGLEPAYEDIRPPLPPPLPPPPSGTIAIVPSTISFTGIIGGSRPGSINVTVKTGNGNSWASKDSCSFFDATPTSGTSGSSHTLTPNAGWDSLAAGTYQCPIIYSSSGNSSLTVQVTAVKQSGTPPPPPPPPDTTPPVRSNGSPSGMIVAGTTQTTMSLSTNESASCRYETSAGVSYGSMRNVFTITGGSTHSGIVTGLTNGGSYSFFVRCQDTAGNANTNDFTISFSVAQPSAAGLVAAYGFNESAGTSVGDATGKGHTGTITNTTWTTQGKFGKALSFNGTNSWVTVADKNDLDLTTGMTLEAWVFPTAAATATNWRNVIIKERAGGEVYNLYADTDAHRPAAYVVKQSSPNSPLGVNGTSQIPLNTWTHLALTYNNSSLIFYVNGNSVRSVATSGALLTSTGVLRIGGNSVWGEFFQGRIDEVRIYNRALTRAEIQADMKAPIGQ